MLAATVLALSSAAVEGDGLRLEFDAHMRSRVVSTRGTGRVLGPFTESEVLVTSSGEIG
jgi:hypothetical protein